MNYLTRSHSRECLVQIKVGPLSLRLPSTKGVAPKGSGVFIAYEKRGTPKVKSSVAFVAETADGSSISATFAGAFYFPVTVHKDSSGKYAKKLCELLICKQAAAGEESNDKTVIGKATFNVNDVDNASEGRSVFMKLSVTMIESQQKGHLEVQVSFESPSAKPAQQLPSQSERNSGTTSATSASSSTSSEAGSDPKEEYMQESCPDKLKLEIRMRDQQIANLNAFVANMEADFLDVQKRMLQAVADSGIKSQLLLQAVEDGEKYLTQVLTFEGENMAFRKEKDALTMQVVELTEKLEAVSRAAQEVGADMVALKLRDQSPPKTSCGTNTAPSRLPLPLFLSSTRKSISPSPKSSNPVSTEASVSTEDVVKYLQEKLEKSESARDANARRCEELEDELSHVEEELVHTRTALASCKSLIVTMGEEQEESQTRTTSLVGDLLEKTTALHDAQRNNKHLKDGVAALDKRLQTQSFRIEELVIELDTARAEMAQCISEKDDEIIRMKVRLNKTEKSAAQVQKELGEKTAQLLEVVADAEDLCSKLASMQAKNEQLSLAHEFYAKAIEKIDEDLCESHWADVGTSD